MTDLESIIRSATEKGFDEVAADINSIRSVYLKISNSEVDSIVEKQNMSCDLFLVKNKKVLFLSDISDTSKASIDKILQNGIKAIGKLRAKEDYYGLAEPPFKKTKANFPYDKEIERCDNSTLADKANAAINGALKKGATTIAGMLVVSSVQTENGTGNGFYNKENWSSARFSIRTFHKKLSFQDVVASRKLSDINFEKAATKGADMMKNIKNTGKIKNGVYDIIYLPSPGGSLLTYINSAACMTSAETGSIFTGKLNKEVAHPDLKIYDDGRIEDGIGSSAYDSEGTASQCTTIVEGGVFKNYLHNHSTAKKYKTKSTGNAGLISPQPRSLVMKHKNTAKDIESMIREVKNGILITNSWYTRFSNYISGDFSTVPRDLAILIRNGEPVYAIKQKDIGAIVGIRISDNLTRMMKNIELVEKNVRQCASWDTDFDYFFVPSFLVKDVKVTVV
jgi:PmbA protein